MVAYFDLFRTLILAWHRCNLCHVQIKVRLCNWQINWRTEKWACNVALPLKKFVSFNISSPFPPRYFIQKVMANWKIFQTFSQNYLLSSFIIIHDFPYWDSSNISRLYLVTTYCTVVVLKNFDIIDMCSHNVPICDAMIIIVQLLEWQILGNLICLYQI